MSIQRYYFRGLTILGPFREKWSFGEEFSPKNWMAKGYELWWKNFNEIYELRLAYFHFEISVFIYDWKFDILGEFTLFDIAFFFSMVYACTLAAKLPSDFVLFILRWTWLFLLFFRLFLRENFVWCKLNFHSSLCGCASIVNVARWKFKKVTRKIKCSLKPANVHRFSINSTKLYPEGEYDENLR